MRLTKYGRREWITATVGAWGLCVLLVLLARRVSWAFLPGIIVPFSVWLWVLWFFRDPHRSAPQGKGLFISPADGRVADITPVGPDSVLGCDGVKIGVFMSVFSVHVNRSPADALVVRVEHTDGLFLDVRDPQAGFRNEAVTIYFTCTGDGAQDAGAEQGATYPLVVRQVAGLIARRIVTDLKPGQIVHAGERIGMIKFGSRLELFVPSQLAGCVAVEIGQYVHAGTTVLVSAAGES